MTGRTVTIALLVGAIVASAAAVIDSSHDSRRLFNEWQGLQKQAYRLNEDWGRLLLERSTWAAHDRVEQLAADRLMMVVPENEALQLVRVDGQTGH
ncbi:cell division protein FtsL [Litorivivens lipolytica]|uniref:Cell division protein FtsL n=1 Tax=Litorivivens lipolytica TaxID=1524264 RepID=A0A7W4W556_9GAMM|nr:cell division protein FtsL [Litorivivens lipolytica]MBB3047084.1 cell division protein FtsL [Litorivivens lipolytica]